MAFNANNLKNAADSLIAALPSDPTVLDRDERELLRSVARTIDATVRQANRSKSSKTMRTFRPGDGQEAWVNPVQTLGD